MLDCSSVGIHFVYVNSGDTRVPRIVVEQIQKIHVRPHIVADGDDLMDDNARLGALFGDLAEEFSQRVRAVRNERVVLDIRGADEFAYEFLRLLLVDHQIIKAKDVVLIANGATIVDINGFNHG